MFTSNKTWQKNICIVELFALEIWNEVEYVSINNFVLAIYMISLYFSYFKKYFSNLWYKLCSMSNLKNSIIFYEIVFMKSLEL